MSTNTDRAQSRHIPVREDWLALSSEEAIDPALPIVDPHHHLWNREGHQYYLSELLADTSTGHNIVATIFVECHAMYRDAGPEHMKPVGEVEFANGIAAMSASGGFGETHAATGIIGYANLGMGASVEAVLEAEVAVAGGRFRGVRNSSVWHPDPAARGSSVNAPADVLRQADFREGLKCLTKMGLSFDAWMSTLR